MRTLAAVLAVGLAASAAVAQSPAGLPSAAVLRAVNLATDWSAAIPVDGRRDGVARVQVADGGQVFVQTKAGLLVAVDANTGSTQWAARYDSPYPQLFPLAVTDEFVFAVSVGKLYAIHRYTGTAEFAYKLPISASAGPVADPDRVYVVLGAGRVVAYDLPRAVKMPDAALLRRDAYGAYVPDQKNANPADQVANRYPSTGRRASSQTEAEDSSKIKLGSNTGATATLQRTPSLSTVPSVLPPYQVFDANGKYIVKSESLSTLSSLRRPYMLRDPSSGSSQRTPSISTVASIGRVAELTNLVARGVEPTTRWIYGSTVRLDHQPLLTSNRIWVTADAPVVYAVLKDDKSPQISAPLTDRVSAAPGQAEDVGFFPLADGNLLALDLTAGSGVSYRQMWRANVGGTMNHPPLPTADSVYMAGDNSGVVRLDRTTGELLWKTDPGYDQVLAVLGDLIYIRDRSGRVHAFDKTRVSDAATKRAYPLAAADFSGYPVAVTNGKTDRLLIATEGGLLVCLRDAAAGRPTLVAPPLVKLAPKPVPPPADAPPPPPKKEPEKKEPEKKDPPKKEPEKK